MKNNTANKKYPQPIGPYSPVITYNNIVFTSGQIPIDPKTSILVKGNFKVRVQQVLINIKLLLEESNSSFDNIIKTTVYLTDLSRFDELNDVFKKTFNKNRPARSVVEVCKLPMNSDVEIECIAFQNK